MKRTMQQKESRPSDGDGERVTVRVKSAVKTGPKALAKAGLQTLAKAGLKAGSKTLAETGAKGGPGALAKAGKKIADSPAPAVSAASGGRAREVQQSDLDLGATIRALRKQAALSLSQIAHETGLSAAMISQIERGLSTPSLRSLRLLSLALKVPVSQFFEEREKSQVERFVVRYSERRRLQLSRTGVVKHLVSPDETGILEIYDIELAPGASSGKGYQSAEGEKAGVVTAGELTLFINQETFVLKDGDAFRVPASVPHRFTNASADNVRVLWMTALPSWAMA